MAQKKKNKKEVNYILIFVLLLLVVIVYSSIQNGREVSMKEFPNIDESNLVTTNSGLQYQDLKIGTGQAAKAGDLVSVHYTGWLLDGTKFDSSVDRNTPFEFDLGASRVIGGWDEGVQGLAAGGQRLLVIPSNLGYGPSGAGGVIPPDATLVFLIELLEIKQ